MAIQANHNQKITEGSWGWVLTHRGAELRASNGAAVLMHEAGWQVSEPDMALIENAPKLLAFVRDFVELFRESSMTPEDDCHDLFSKAQELLSAIGDEK